MASHTYEDELARTGTVVFPVKGVSMRPLIKAGRDAVFVRAKESRLELFDVGLFKRDNGEYVLHRVLEVQKDGYLFNGDSQTFTEYVREDQVLGVMTGLVRKGKEVDLSGESYRAYVIAWCKWFPLRRKLLRVLHRLGIWVPAKRNDAKKCVSQKDGVPDADSKRSLGSLDSEGTSQVVFDLLHLCGRALAGETVDLERLKRMDLARVHALATDQKLSALAWFGLEPLVKAGIVKGPLVDTWRAERDQAIRRQLLFGAERSRILSALANEGIWYALLKGAVLTDWYPKPGMREFSDNDILFDASHREDVARLFIEMGYDRKSGDRVNALNDYYSKEPIYGFEMHWRLIVEMATPEVARIFEGIEYRLVDADGLPIEPQSEDPSTAPCERHLTPEDFYLFLLAHSYRHHVGAGTGARILCDIAVFLKRMGAELDRVYIERLLEESGMADFAHSLERLAACVFEPDFDPASLSTEDAETLHSLTSYGVYGTVEHQAELRMEREEEKGGSAGEYVFKRIVPSEDWWEINFPFAFRHKWARAPFLLFRYARAALEPERRKRIAIELRALARRIDAGAKGSDAENEGEDA